MLIRESSITGTCNLKFMYLTAAWCSHIGAAWSCVGPIALVHDAHCLILVVRVQCCSMKSDRVSQLCTVTCTSDTIPAFAGLGLHSARHVLLSSSVRFH